MGIEVDPNKIEELAGEYNRLSKLVEDEEVKINKDILSLLRDTNNQYSERYVRLIASEAEDLLMEIRKLAKSITERLNSKSKILKQAAERYRKDEEEAKRLIRESGGFSFIKSIAGPLGEFFITLGKTVSSRADKVLSFILGKGNNKYNTPSICLPLDISPLESHLKVNAEIRSVEVERMQQRLKDAGYDIKVDGYFGNETLAIVNAFKDKYGIVNTGSNAGVVDNQTWLYLFGNLSGELKLNPKEYSEQVRIAQIRLKDKGYDVDITGYFDEKMQKAVNKFKENNKLGNTDKWEGVIGPQTWNVLLIGGLKVIEVKSDNTIYDERINHSKSIEINEDSKVPCTSIKEFKSRYGDLICEYAKRLGVDENVLGAIVYTESGGGGFYKNGSLKIRFEDHIFTGKLGSGKFKEYFIHDSKDYSKEAYRTSMNDEWKQTHMPGKQEISEYGAFEFAKTLDENAAYNSISMGFGQIMGFNYKVLGYKSSKEMFDDFSKSEKQQIIGMMKFIENYNPKMLKALQDDDLDTFGVYYNGSNSYGKKVRNNIEVYRNTKANELVLSNKKQEDNSNSDEITKELIINSKYNMTDTKASNAVIPQYVYNYGERNKDTYNILINQFDVETNPRYQPRNGNTYCNIFAWDVSVAMGVELPRFVEVGKKGNIEDATGKAIGRNLGKGYILYEDLINATATELNANRLATWLEAQGENEGWIEVTPEEAQERANNGYMTISVIKKSGIGHVQVVRPTPDGSSYNKDKGVYIAQAGNSNFNGSYYYEKCRKSDYVHYKFYTHD